MHGQLTPHQQQAVVASWPRWVREEYHAQVDALLWTGWYARPQAEALAWHNMHSLVAVQPVHGVQEAA